VIDNNNDDDNNHRCNYTAEMLQGTIRGVDVDSLPFPLTPLSPFLSLFTSPLLHPLSFCIHNSSRLTPQIHFSCRPVLLMNNWSTSEVTRPT